MANASYAFGDSALAAARLAILADVFAETTADFLLQLDGSQPRLAVDLGCGPGFTTTLLRNVLAPERVIGIDSSAAFVRAAGQRLGATGEVLCADVVDLPGTIDDADLLFARFLLTHLPEPALAIEHWLSRLAPDGAIAVEEVESISTDEAAFETYLALQRRMLEANRTRLEAGPVIEEAVQGRGRVVLSRLVSLTPPTRTVAHMFAMNFESWRARPAVLELASAHELDGIETGLAHLRSADTSGAPITWQLRQLVIAQS